MIKIDLKKVELAIQVIDLKIVDTIKNNTLKTYDELKDKVIELKNEKQEIYNYNEEIIDKVLNKYLIEVKK